MNKTSFIATTKSGKLSFSESEKDKLNIWIDSFDDGVELNIEVSKLEVKRTISQNSAAHLWMTQIAKIFNDNGHTVQKVLGSMRQGVEIYWSASLIKEILWREIQMAVTGKQSTTELSKHEEIDKIVNILTKFCGERLKLEIPPFPSQNELEIK